MKNAYMWQPPIWERLIEVGQHPFLKDHEPVLTEIDRFNRLVLFARPESSRLAGQILLGDRSEAGTATVTEVQQWH